MSSEDGQACILHFPESRAPARGLGQASGLPTSEVEVHRFPDGECRVRLPASLPERVVFLRSLDRPDAKLIELLLAAETARSLGASSLTLVAPYLCYMRQDTAFRPGEAVSQRIVGGFLARLFDGVVTVDPHLHRTRDLADVIPDTDTRVLSATGPMGDFLGTALREPFLVGPDEESEQWVGAIAGRGGYDHVIGTKLRSGDAEVQVTLPAGSFAGRDVVLVDDIASTGRSLVAAAGTIRAHGPRSISALVTHGLFADDAMEQLCAAGIENVWSTDSIPGPSNRIPLARLLAESL